MEPPGRRRHPRPSVSAASSLEQPTARSHANPAHVVEHLGAVQAQDYPGALWSVGMRCAPDAPSTDVEHAIAERRIVRTWPMRGTLHFVAPADVRWMLALLAPRVLARAAKRHAELGLTDAVFERARAIFTEALSGGRHPDTTGDDGAPRGERHRDRRPARLPHPLACWRNRRSSAWARRRASSRRSCSWTSGSRPRRGAEPRADAALARLAARYLAGARSRHRRRPRLVGRDHEGRGADRRSAPRRRLERMTAEGTEYWLPRGAAAVDAPRVARRASGRRGSSCCPPSTSTCSATRTGRCSWASTRKRIAPPCPRTGSTRRRSWWTAGSRARGSARSRRTAWRSPCDRSGR